MPAATCCPPRYSRPSPGSSPAPGGGIQLTDAIRELVGRVPVHAFRFEGKRHDIGSRIDYLRCIVEFALRRPDVGPEFREFLEEILGRGEQQ